MAFSGGSFAFAARNRAVNRLIRDLTEVAARRRVQIEVRPAHKSWHVLVDGSSGAVTDFLCDVGPLLAERGAREVPVPTLG